MIKRTTKTATAAAVPSAAKPAPVRIETAALPLDALASAILTREVKPRVGDVRRLAEAVLAAIKKKQEKKEKRQKKAKKAKKDRRKDGAEPKLSKIPAQRPQK